VKRTQILVTLLAILALLASSCGTGDKIASVSMTASGQTGLVNLEGMGSTLQLQVMANYTSGKSINETNFATYMITAVGTDDNLNPLPTPPYGIELNNTGMITATEQQNGSGLCTWTNLNTTTTALTSPAWYYLGNYTIVATYRGFTSNPVYIPVASGAGNQQSSNDECGPSASGQ